MTALPAMHEAHQRIRDSNVAKSHVNKPLGRGSTRMMTITAFEDRPPESAQLTAYDERHFATYLRLLDADEEGAGGSGANHLRRGSRSRTGTRPHRP